MEIARDREGRQCEGAEWAPKISITGKGTHEQNQGEGLHESVGLVCKDACSSFMIPQYRRTSWNICMPVQVDTRNSLQSVYLLRCPSL